MGKHRKIIRRLTPVIAAAALALPLAALSAGSVAAASAAPAARHASRMTPTVGNPINFIRAGKVQPGQSPIFGCQAPESATNQVPCYGPAQIRGAYNVPSNVTGKGETIAIVDAFQSPTIRDDLALFDSTFGVPSATLNIIAPQGLTPFDPTNADEVSWAGEISLDVEYAHAIAPDATIDLVLAKSDQDTDIFAAQQYVVQHNLGDVFSQSFGEAESCMDPTLLAQTHKLFQQAALERMSVFASAGDDGAALPSCDGSTFIKAVSTPASDPLVTGVGGTHLNADFTTGAYQSESVWNDSGTAVDIGAGGGGFSSVYSKPLYQLGAVPGQARGVPDVSYNGDVFGGVLAACGSCGAGAGAFFIFAGTSSGSPQWAAITALADQAGHHRLGSINPALYLIHLSPALAKFAFHDVTTGNNSWDVTGVTGFSAGQGWDAASGLGTPNVTHLLKLLAP